MVSAAFLLLLMLSIKECCAEMGHTKDLKNGICCFSCFNAQHLRVAQSIKKQSVDYVSESKINSVLAL